MSRSGWAWSGRWIEAEERLRAVEARLVRSGNVVRRGGDFDRWDMELRGRPLGSARILLCVEGLGGGAQLVRYRCSPVIRRMALVPILASGVLAVVAGIGGAYLMALIAATVGALVAAFSLVDSGAALGVV